MPSNSLSELGVRLDDQVYWVDEQSNRICFADIQKFITRNRQTIECSVNKNVAISLRSRSLTAQLLFCLDGICRILFVVPQDVESGHLPQLLAQANINVLLTDKPIKVSDANISVKNIISGRAEPTSDRQAKKVFHEPLSTQWLIATSGTTGFPKLLVHTLSELTGSVKTDTTKGKEFTWGLLYDLSRYAGLQVYLQSLLGGSSLLIPDSQQPLNQQISYLAQNNCNALSATPTLWRKILMTPQVNSLQLRHITLGGESVDQSVINALQHQFPKSKIIHIYASTEAGVGFSVSDKLSGFPSSYLKDAPDHVSMKVVEGRLFIKSTKTAKERLDRKSLKDKDGYVDTGDMVTYDRDRYYFLGRASGLINVGGNKVYPEEIEKVLLSYQFIKLAYVYAKKSHVMGNLVACDIVVDTTINVDAANLKKQIRNYCAEHLTDWKIPAIFKIVDDIDVSLSGKQLRK